VSSCGGKKSSSIQIFYNNPKEKRAGKGIKKSKNKKQTISLEGENRKKVSAVGSISKRGGGSIRQTTRDSPENKDGGGRASFFSGGVPYSGRTTGREKRQGKHRKTPSGSLRLYEKRLP